MLTRLWEIHVAQLPRAAGTLGGTGNPQAYIVNRRSSLDSINDFQLGSPFPIIPFPTALTPGTDVPFYWFTVLAGDDTPQAKIRRKKWLYTVIAGDDFVLGSPLPILTAPIDETILSFSSLENFDLVPGDRRNRNRKIQLQGASQSQPDVTGIFIEFINGTTYAAISCNLLTEIQRHVLEPTIDNGVTWTLWTQAEVLGFLNLRIQRFMLETGLIRKSATITADAGDLNYPTDLMEARRLEFVGGLTRSPLERLDQMLSDNSYINWPATTDTPVAFIEEPKISLVFQLVPPPSTLGTVDVSYVPLPATIGADCTPLPFPNIFANFIKWGTIADMLRKEGEANDPARADVAEQRFLEGVELAKLLLGTKR